MNQRLYLFLWSLTGFLLLFFSAFSIIKGGLINIGFALVMIMPFFFIIFLHLRKIWHVLVLLFLVMNAFTFPLYGLRQLTPILILLFAATLILLLDGTIRHSRRIIKFNIADRLIMIVAIIMTLRILHDRPGFVALGSGQGGFIPALTYVSATWFYFTIRIFVAQATFTRKQLIRTLPILLLVCIMTVYNGSKTGVFIGRYFTGSPFWLLCAILLSLLSTSTKEQLRILGFYIVSAIFLAMALLSQFRSRIFFFAAEIFSIAYFMKRFRKTAIVLGIWGSIGLVTIIASGHIPKAMTKVFSLFMEVEHVEITAEGGTGRYGWKDSGRAELYVASWEKIKENPILGGGLGLDVGNALEILATSKHARTEMLILTGSYHNSIVAIAAKCGIPAAFLISWAFLYIIIRYVQWLKKINDPVIKTWGMTLVAFWCANTFMLLMNGGQNQFFTEVVLSGFMMGMMTHPNLSNPKTLLPLEWEENESLDQEISNEKAS